MNAGEDVEELAKELTDAHQEIARLEEMFANSETVSCDSLRPLTAVWKRLRTRSSPFITQ